MRRDRVPSVCVGRSGLGMRGAATITEISNLGHPTSQQKGRRALEPGNNVIPKGAKSDWILRNRVEDGPLGGWIQGPTERAPEDTKWGGKAVEEKWPEGCKINHLVEIAANRRDCTTNSDS